MSNIEKIRQEIERLKNIAENNNASEYLRGQARVCRVILSFIDTLPEEKSEIPINLTWQDIATIDSLLTEVGNSYAIGNFDYDGERENFYQKVLDEYNRLHQTKA